MVVNNNTTHELQLCAIYGHKWECTTQPFYAMYMPCLFLSVFGTLTVIAWKCYCAFRFTCTYSMNGTLLLLNFINKHHRFCLATVAPQASIVIFGE